MSRSHGEAERLWVEDVDLELIDRAIASGGEDEEAARMVMANGFLGPKRFGKMFPDLEPFRRPRGELANLGRAMRELAPEDPALNNSEIAAGFTYLGQFIDHDITADKTQGFPRINDPEEIEQARTPSLDLDSLYGLGPKRQPELYDKGFPKRQAMFRIGLTSSAPSPGGSQPGTPDIPVSLPNDLPRRANTQAIIGDPRNDENLLVAQTHLAFLKFHNRVMDTLPQGQATEDDGPVAFTMAEEDDERKRRLFHKARRLVRWHYQWIVLNDFLPKIIDPNVLTDIRTNGRRFYDFDQEPFGGRPFMPIEFSVAAYRLGHSMVREQYNYNRVFADFSVEPNSLTPATLGLLFTFTGGGGGAPIPSNWIIDWRRLHSVGRRSLLNFTRKLDTKLIPQLHQLPSIAPGEPNSLAVRNLLRGARLGIPAAQDVAEAMGITPLRPNQIASGDDGEILREHGFHQRTPLWYYILKEAELQGEGERLGEIGSRIVGEVFVGLIEGDPHSFLAKRPDWTPTLPSATPGTFTMADLLKFVGEINPIGR